MSSKTTDAKLFFLLSFFGVIIYIVLAFYSFHTAYIFSKVKKSQVSNALFNLPYITESTAAEDLKYILIYTADESHELQNFKEGRREFYDYTCSHTNCYLTNKEHLKKDIRGFDAVVINVTELNHLKLPKLRADYQKYIFYSMEPPDHTNVCRKEFESYFNWTWTYKLYSDVLSPFFLVKDVNGEIVAPKHKVKWAENTNNLSEHDDRYLPKRKARTAVATIIRNCNDKEGKLYSKKIRAALKRYDLKLDVIQCGKGCANETEECDSITNLLIQNSYYFLLIQEKTLAEDYLTDKILVAYLNGLVPIIKSGAKLHKFLPPGSYINAHRVTPEKIAAIIFYTIDNPKVYEGYFRWKDTYTFHRRRYLEGICELCEHLNDERWVNDYRTYDTFRNWWYNRQADEICGSNVTKNIDYSLVETDFKS